MNRIKSIEKFGFFLQNDIHIDAQYIPIDTHAQTLLVHYIREVDEPFSGVPPNKHLVGELDWPSNEQRNQPHEL